MQLQMTYICASRKWQNHILTVITTINIFPAMGSVLGSYGKLGEG